MLDDKIQKDLLSFRISQDLIYEFRVRLAQHRLRGSAWLEEKIREFLAQPLPSQPQPSQDPNNPQQ